MARLDVFSFILLSLLYSWGTETCPETCRCTVTHVACSARRLTKVPTNIPNDSSILALHVNAITTWEKGTFEGLENLQELYLQYNRITTLEKGAFKGLGSLRTLDLESNDITTLEKETFAGLENLQKLYLQNNKLTTLQKGIFEGLSRLTNLYLHNNKISTLEIEAFEGLENLLKLHLFNNQITKLEKGTFEGLESLHTLKLHSNKITTLEKGTFEGLENLQKLNLAYNKITTLEKGTFEGLENLQELLLPNNEISAMEKETFERLESLQHLYLYNNEIATLEKTTFEGLKNLQTLAIDGNPLHCNCQMVAFITFATTKSLRLKLYYTEPRCESPVNLNGTLLKDLLLQEMDCHSDSTSNPRSTGIGVVSTTALTPDNSTEIMERSDIVCNADSIEVFLPVQFFSVPSRVTWLDPNCSITSNSTHYVSTIKHGQCGTTVSLTKDNVIFENEIKASVLTTQNIFVNFGKPFVIPVKCIYPRKEMTLSSYQPLKQQVRVYEKRFGHLDIDMRQYETNQFRHALEESNYPRKHILNSDIFFKVTLQNNGAAELGIRLDTCIATKTSSPYDNVFIKLIENGCPKVNFVHLLPSPVNETRFSLSAFEFTSSQSNVVYIHCQASVCLAASQCTSDCTASGRTKRDLSSEPSHLLSMGPLMFVSDKVYASNLVANAIAGVSATIAMVAIVVAVMGWRRKTKGNVKDNQLY